MSTNSSPFTINQEYRRRDLHIQYGGNRQTGICSLGKHPFIFIFTGSSAEQHGYKDKWDDENVFSYTGEGQSGDMTFTRGNLALRDHIKNNKRVFLFEQSKKRFVKFVDELALFKFDYYETPDRTGNTRRGIKFFLKRKGALIPNEIDQTDFVSEPPMNYRRSPITEAFGLVVSRVGQGAYRESIIDRWENKCAVTGFGDARILIASHIHPWRYANDDERLDVDNGILLSPIYDALFDQHLITFDNSGKILLSETISRREFEKIGVSGKEKIANFNAGNFFYLEKHRILFDCISKGLDHDLPSPLHFSILPH